MSSPFSMFRRNQKTMMVVATALAMISFVLLPALMDTPDVPMPLMIIFFACMAGGVGWLAGLKTGKAQDWGFTGLVLGVLVAVLMLWSGRESSAVVMEGGDLSRQELTELMRQRQAANQFVQMAIQGSDKNISQTEYQRRMIAYAFGGDTVTDEDAVTKEVLLREAEAMGIVVSDKSATDYIKNMTNGKMTRDLFTEIRRDLGVTERELLDILKDEIAARTVVNLLYANNQLTPQNYWEFYEKLNETRSAEMVSVLVKDFVDDVEDPTDAEVEQFFQEYRGNYPNITVDGRLEEGRPGFRQPPRVQAAYLEAVYDEIESTLDEVTEEEIQERFEAEYLRSVPEEPIRAPLSNESLLTNPPILLPEDDTKTEATEAEKAPEEKSEGEPETPKAESSENSQPEEETTPAAEESSNPESTEETEAPEAEESLEEKTPSEEPESEESPQEDSSEETSEETPQASISFADELQFVSLQQEDEPEAQPDEPQAEEKPALPAPNAEESKPAEETPQTEAEKQPQTEDAAQAENADGAKTDQPDSEKKETESSEEPMDGESGEGKDVPPEPEGSEEPETPVLTDEIRAELRDAILRERTQQEIAKRMESALGFVANLGRNVAFGEVVEEGFISAEDATQQIKDYAEKNQLLYVETPFLSAQELSESEDYSVGATYILPTFQPTPTLLLQSAPTDRFRPKSARNLQTQSEYVVWKLAHKPSYVPETLEDEPKLREQVVDAWKLLKALPKAEARAQELAKMVRESDKPMSEALGEVKTDDGLFLNVMETGEFSWMTRGFAPSNSFQQPNPPRRSQIPAAPDAGERLFEKVFEDLQPGQVGIAPNQDDTALYVIRIKKDEDQGDGGEDQMRSRFLAQGLQPDYRYLGQEKLYEFTGNLREDLWEKYNVQMFTSNETSE